MKKQTAKHIGKKKTNPSLWTSIILGGIFLFIIVIQVSSNSSNGTPAVSTNTAFTPDENSVENSDAKRAPNFSLKDTNGKIHK
jgi:hypothetical protein